MISECVLRFPAVVSLYVVVLLVCGSGCKSCGEHDVETPIPIDPKCGTCAPAEFVETHPQVWAMMRQTLIKTYVYESLITKPGWYEQIAWSYYLVTWADQGGGALKQTEQLCASEFSEIAVETKVGGIRYQQTVIPSQTVASVTPATWDATLSENTSSDAICPITFQWNDSVFGPLYSVMGAHLDDPATDHCPVDENGVAAADQPEEYDQDNDGNPGITTEQWVNGEPYADLYMCSRTVYRLEPGSVCFYDEAQTQYKIQGFVDELEVDQSMYGSDNASLEGYDPQTKWEKNEDSYYVLLSLSKTPSEASCADVSRDLFIEEVAQPTATP